MKAWIFSIVGIVVLSVLLDLILEEGETKKYIKGIVALLAVIVIASPIPKVLRGEINFVVTDAPYQYSADKNYLQELNTRRMHGLETLTEERLSANKIGGAEVCGVLDITCTEYKLCKVVVQLKKSGINEGQTNINNKELILKIVAEGMRADKEVIVLE